MFRERDYNFLQSMFNRNTNDIVILYGDRRAGIFDLVNEFISEKSSFYYNVPCADYKIQEQLFIKELNIQKKIPQFINKDLDSILTSYLASGDSSKKVIVFDEFTNLFPGYPSILNYLLYMSTVKADAGSLLILLCTSDIYFVENELYSKINNKMYELSAVYRINEFSYPEICERFTGIDDINRFILYSIYGGNSIFWDKVAENIDYKEYLYKYLLNQNSDLFYEGMNIIPERIRQGTYYNSILYAISNGYNTLALLYDYLGTDKAKISVYIKNLIKSGILKKQSDDIIGNKGAVKKGVYKTVSPFINFWYRYIFGNISSLNQLSPERFYKKIIENNFSEYINCYYSEYCKILLYNYIKECNVSKIDKIIDYEDKKDCIDFIAVTQNNTYIVCSCEYSYNYTTYKKYELLLEALKISKIKYEIIVLFSDKGFESKLLDVKKKSSKLLLYDENNKWY